MGLYVSYFLPGEISIGWMTEMVDDMVKHGWLDIDYEYIKRSE